MAIGDNYGKKNEMNRLLSSWTWFKLVHIFMVNRHFVPLKSKERIDEKMWIGDDYELFKRRKCTYRIVLPNEYV